MAVDDGSLFLLIIEAFRWILGHSDGVFVWFEVVMKETLIMHDLQSLDDVHDDVEPVCSIESRDLEFNGLIERVDSSSFLVSDELENEWQGAFEIDDAEKLS